MAGGGGGQSCAKPPPCRGMLHAAAPSLRSKGSMLLISLPPAAACNGWHAHTRVRVAPARCAQPAAQRTDCSSSVSGSKQAMRYGEYQLHMQGQRESSRQRHHRKCLRLHTPSFALSGPEARRGSGGGSMTGRSGGPCPSRQPARRSGQAAAWPQLTRPCGRCPTRRQSQRDPGCRAAPRSSPCRGWAAGVVGTRYGGQAWE